MDSVVPPSLPQKHVVAVTVPTGRHYAMDFAGLDWTRAPTRAHWFQTPLEASKLAAEEGGFVMPLREAMELDVAA